MYRGPTGRGNSKRREPHIITLEKSGYGLELGTDNQGL